MRCEINVVAALHIQINTVYGNCVNKIIKDSKKLLQKIVPI